MRTTVSILISLFLFLPSLAEDAPLLTPKGLEAYKLGSPPPDDSGFPGLTAQRVQTKEMQEGEVYEVSWLKFYQDGHYLGKAMLQEGKLYEIVIVDAKVRYEGGFAVGSTWDEIQRVFPGPQLHFTYVSDRLFADSEYQEGVQVNFAKEDYVGTEELRWEFQNLKDDALKANAEAQSIRIF